MQNSCVECGHRCSPAAKACPNCGQPDPTSPPLSLTNQIEGSTGCLVMLIAAFVFLTWIFAPSDKFYIVLFIGIGLAILIMLLGFLAKSIVNWEKSIGYVLVMPCLIWGMISYHDKNYGHLFLAVLIGLPGVVILLKSTEDR